MFDNPILPAESSAVSIPRPLLLVTEGVLDIDCLTRLSQIVRSNDAGLPDLETFARQGRVVFLPAGGGDLAAWIDRLAPLGCGEFHLYDREQAPESDLRQHIVSRINRRPGCRAVLTKMRSLGNYLHPAAIEQTFGVRIEIAHDTPVAERVAQARPEVQLFWSVLTPRARRRLIYRTKRRLNTETVQHMTAEMLAEHDSAGEVVSWMRAIAELLEQR